MLCGRESERSVCRAKIDKRWSTKVIERGRPIQLAANLQMQLGHFPPFGLRRSFKRFRLWSPDAHDCIVIISIYSTCREIGILLILNGSSKVMAHVQSYYSSTQESHTSNCLHCVKGNEKSGERCCEWCCDGEDDELE